ncbi:MAG: alpha/beta hydrolase [Planctomycetes bacterium]|nr:alpha/beta hydrolase [Planctomycetota bacterium]
MKRSTLWLAFLWLAFAFLTSLGGLQDARAGEKWRIDADVIYGRRDGMVKTFDVIRPAKANGAGVLWIESGGWYSNWTDPKNKAKGFQFMLDKGYTMFIVRHASAPKYTVPEAAEDVRRCVRVIRQKAKDYDVDSERLGVMGASAGGHLSLMLGTTGDDGNSSAKDEALRQKSRVAAVVAIFPPTDLRGWTTDPPEAIKKLPGLKPPLTFKSELEASVSPLLKVSGESAPTLFIHGDKDELVPIDHSRKMLSALESAKVPTKLVLIEGAGHGFSPKQNQEQVQPAMVEWFERYLAKSKSENRNPKSETIPKSE